VPYFQALAFPDKLSNCASRDIPCRFAHYGVDFFGYVVRTS